MTKLPPHRIPQFLIFNPIPASLFRSATLLPSLIARIESLFVVEAFQTDFGFTDMPTYLLLEALTAPSTNLGYSYERLETLGDGFLKVALGLHLFMKHPYVSLLIAEF
jgi:endoribonuclease Dicer